MTPEVWILGVPLSLLAARVLVKPHSKVFPAISGAALLSVPVFWVSGLLLPLTFESIHAQHTFTALLTASGVLIGAVLGLLLGSFTVALVLGHVLSVLVFAALPFPGLWVRGSCALGAAMLVLVVSLKYSRPVQILSSAICGSYLLVSSVLAIVLGSFVSLGFEAFFSFHEIECNEASCLISGICFACLVVLSLVAHFVIYCKYGEPEGANPSAHYVHVSSVGDMMFRMRSVSSDNTLDIRTKHIADYNFFDEENMSDNLKSIYNEISGPFEEIGVRFGFQIDNIRNQREHLLMLLANVSSRNPKNAIDELHAKVFSNYRQWCRFLAIPALIASSRSLRQEQKLSDLVIWTLLWGEAANLRHVPECLCFLLHSLLQDYRGREDLSFPSGTFLSFVVKPIFDIVKTPGKVPEGSPPKNYDDYNEFFWTRGCLNYYYGMPKLKNRGPDNSDAKGQPLGSLPRPSISSIHDFVKASPGGRPHVAEGLANFGKTFIEKRSFLRFILAFWRFFSFFGVLFYLSAVFAVLQQFEIPIFTNFSPTDTGFQALLSVVILLSLSKVIKEVLETWSCYGVWPSSAFFIRLLVKYSFFLALTLSYICSFSKNFGFAFKSWTNYQILSGVFAIPLFIELLYNLAPFFYMRFILPAAFRIPLLPYFIRYWWPLMNCYVGRNMPVSFGEAIRYDFFWGSLLVWKLFCSYLFEVQPIILPTIHYIESGAFSDEHKPFALLFHLFMLSALWIPFLLVFYIDVTIWYCVWQAAFGLLVGTFLEQLGKVTDFSKMKEMFLQAPGLFHRKLLGSSRLSFAVRNQVKRDLSFDSPFDDRQYDEDEFDHNAPEDELKEPLLIKVDKGSDEGLGFAEKSTNILKRGSPIKAASPSRSSDIADDEKLADMALFGSSSVFQSGKMLRFSHAWNAIVRDLRSRDLLSNAEMDFLVFRRVAGREDRVLYLPSFITAGCLEKFTSFAVDVHQESLSSGLSPAENALNSGRAFDDFLTSEPVVQEAVLELWELTSWIVQSLLGDQHAEGLQKVYVEVETLAKKKELIPKMQGNLHKLEKVKPALMDLIRLLNIGVKMRAGKPKSAVASSMDHHSATIPVTSPPSLSLAAERKEHFDSKSPEHSPMPHGLPILNRASTGGLTSSMSFGTLNMLEKLQRQLPQATDKDVILVRKQLRTLLEVFSSLFNASSAPTLAKFAKSVFVDKEGFFWNDIYTREQFDETVTDEMCPAALKALQMLLNLATLDAKPESAEAQRRLLFFMNSLLQDMPEPPKVSECLSMSTLTPFYSEDVIYSKTDLETEWTSDSVSPMLYLQTVHQQQWKNFVERSKGTPATASAAASLGPGSSVKSVFSSGNEIFSREARLWATRLGQTLYRTALGIMLYEDALRLLARLENPVIGDQEVDEICKLKFNYVISAQVFGQQRQTLDPKALDIEGLLHELPNLRVAYIETAKVHTFNERNEPVELDEFYSVLLKSEKLGSKKEIMEVYRIKLPGNPMIGEGKPENQNHAIIFTRGEYLQAIDMNQDNYFEEALKMRNLLEIFPGSSSATAAAASSASATCCDNIVNSFCCWDNSGSSNGGSGGSGSTGSPQHFGFYDNVTIVGFREHIFTGGLSSLANFMALQEGTFVSLGQRVLSEPLRLRFHYGHPDIFDKMFFFSRGGISKASKGVNLAEDIFAGYNNTLRGGSVSMREFTLCGKGRDVGLQQLFKFEAKLAQAGAEQSLSRDVYRLGSRLDFPRLLAMYNGGPGWYFSAFMTVVAAFLFAYSKLLFLLFSNYKDSPVAIFANSAPLAETSLAYWFGQIGFLMTVPTFSALGVDNGFRFAAWEVLRMILSGGPLFFVFNMATKWFFFSQTLIAGNAQYRPTGRGFVTKHETFAELFRFFWTSHFLPAAELASVLLLGAALSPYSSGKDAASAFGASTTWSLWILVFSWMFSAFWFNPLGFQWEATVVDMWDWWLWMQRSQGDAQASWRVWWAQETDFYMNLPVRKRILLSVFSLRHLVIIIGLIVYGNCSTLVLGQAVALVGSGCAVFAVFNNRFARRYGKMAGFAQFLTVAGAVAIVVAVSRSMRASPHPLGVITAIFAVLGTICWLVVMFLIWGRRGIINREFCRLAQFFVGGVLFIPLLAISLAYLPSVIQTRILFHNAFSRGVVIEELLKSNAAASAKKEAKPAETPAASTPAGQDPGFASLVAAQTRIVEEQQREISRLIGLLQTGGSKGTGLVAPSPGGSPPAGSGTAFPGGGERPIPKTMTMSEYHKVAGGVGDHPPV